jgi:hypothetical protein
MFVDFGQSSLLSVAKHMQLLKVSGGKRKRLAEDPEIYFRKRMLLLSVPFGNNGTGSEAFNCE